MPLPDAVFLAHMPSAVDRLPELVAKTDREAFNGDWVIQDAVIRELEVLGEAAGRVSPCGPRRKLCPERYADETWL